MISYQVEGLERTMRNLQRYSQEIRFSIELTLLEAKDSIVYELQNLFPDLIFTSQFFPQNLEVWIYVDEIVICKLTGKRIDTRTESQVGRERGAGKTPFARDFNIKELTERFGRDTALKIKQRIEVILK